MIIREITAKSIVSKTGIPGFDYCINPYIGCGHACRYCYAAYITQRFRGHAEPWGTFIDVKINAPILLERRLKRLQKGPVYISSVTDCYQPAEKRYRLTQSILKLLLAEQFPVTIQTKSPLIMRDVELLKQFENIEVGMTVTTDDNRIGHLFEPGAPPVSSRISALKELHKAGLPTYVFIGPMLPLNPEVLVDSLEGGVDYILVDRLNYAGRIRGFYKRHGLERYFESEYFRDAGETLKEKALKKGLRVELLF